VASAVRLGTGADRPPPPQRPGEGRRPPAPRHGAGRDRARPRHTLL